MATDPTSVLGLCAGYGGLDLSVELAFPGARTVCYVEREAAAAAILASRMAEGSLAQASIWSDLFTFDARAWRGKVDCVAAGFPCQPWSVAGDRQGTSDERWIWPRIAEIIAAVGAQWVWLENVRGLVSGGGLDPVMHDLAGLGFDAEWGCLRASDVSAPHQRERVFILAHHHDAGRSLKRGGGLLDGERPALGNDPDGCYPAVAHSRHGMPQGQQSGRPAPRATGRGGGAEVGDADRDLGRERRAGPTGRDGTEHARTGCPGLFPPGPDSPDWRGIIERSPHLAPAIEPGLRFVADGDAVVLDEARAHQLRGAGNGVVVAQAAVALRLLLDRFWREH